MRRLLLSLTAAVFLLSAPAAALAAPTCLDANGGQIRCGTPGAMPVGWTPPPEQAVDREDVGRADPDQIAFLICFLGGLFALIALLPDFDGWRPGGPGDPQEKDEEEERG